MRQNIPFHYNYYLNNKNKTSQIYTSPPSILLDSSSSLTPLPLKGRISDSAPRTLYPRTRSLHRDTLVIIQTFFHIYYTYIIHHSLRAAKFTRALFLSLSLSISHSFLKKATKYNERIRLTSACLALSFARACAWTRVARPRAGYPVRVSRARTVLPRREKARVSPAAAGVLYSHILVRALRLSLVTYTRLSDSTNLTLACTHIRRRISRGCQWIY